MASWSLSVSITSTWSSITVKDASTVATGYRHHLREIDIIIHSKINAAANNKKQKINPAELMRYFNFVHNNQKTSSSAFSTIV